MAKIDYAEVVKEANEAAERAGNKWVAEHTAPVWVVIDELQPDPTKRVVGAMLDVCGFSYLRLADKRTGFAKFLAKKCGERGYRPNSFKPQTKYYARQELGLQEAEAFAALKVFESYGIKGLQFYSNID